MAERMPKLNTRLLKPYVSFAVFVQPEERASAEIVCDAIRHFIEEDDRSSLVADGLRRTRKAADEPCDVPLALAYTHHRIPPWGGLDQSRNDTSNHDMIIHLVVVMQLDRLIAIHSTDNRVKAHLRTKQAKLELGGVGLLTRPALEEALLKGEIATFVMGAGHADRGRPGPKSKIHYGDRLEDSIDPVGDQRHTLAGARAAADEELLGAGREGVVGVNLEGSGFWLRRGADWSQFLDVSAKLLQAINDVLAAGGGRERFAIFARYIDSLDEVERPYDVGFAPPNQAIGETPTEEEVDAYDWLTQHIAFVEATGRRTARLTFVDDDGQFCKMTLRPVSTGANSVRFDLTRAEGDSDLASQVLRGFDRVELTIYYESGHTVTSRGVLMEFFGDVPFGGWDFHDLSAVDISSEKPGDGSWETIREIGGSDTDDSLFGWVIRNNRSGWLLCDDGPDELCDFVHFDPTAGRLSIWHVKACKSGPTRRIAAVPYEQVCAQVQKNLTSILLPNLIKELEKRRVNNRVGPLWKDGSPASDLATLISALKAPRSNLERIVKILQPHVTQEHLDAARGSDGPSADDQQRLRRLDHLLISTGNAVGSASARVEVVTAKTVGANAEPGPSRS